LEKNVAKDANKEKLKLLQNIHQNASETIFLLHPGIGHTWQNICMPMMRSILFQLFGGTH